MGSASPRQAFPDRLRGIALLGIVVVNAPLLGISVDGFTPQSLSTVWDKIAVFFVIALAQSKFYLLFSFLFGYSAAFILRDNSHADRRRFVRRLIGLLVIGLVHATFFYIGDILVAYAVLGFALLAVSRYSDRALKLWAIAAFAVGLTLPLAMLGPMVELDPNTLIVPQNPNLAALDAAFADGTFLETAAARWQAASSMVGAFVQQGALAFGCFCLGLLAARHRLLADPEEHRDLWRRMAIIGIGVGLPIQILGAAMAMTGLGNTGQATTVSVLGSVIVFSTAPILAAGMMGLLGWGLAVRPGLASFAAAPGRASLSVYIGESVILSLAFCSYGLGYFGKWGVFAVTMAAMSTWLVLALLAHVWLHYFSRGPLEALLAAWTGDRVRTDSRAA